MDKNNKDLIEQYESKIREYKAKIKALDNSINTAIYLDSKNRAYEFRSNESKRTFDSLRAGIIDFFNINGKSLDARYMTAYSSLFTSKNPRYEKDGISIEVVAKK